MTDTTLTAPRCPVCGGEMIYDDSTEWWHCFGDHAEVLIDPNGKAWQRGYILSGVYMDSVLELLPTDEETNE